MKKSLKSKFKKVHIGRVVTSLRVGNTANHHIDTNGKAVHTGTASVEEVTNLLMTATRGHMVTNFKSRSFDTGSIVSKNLVKPEPEVMEMYKQLLALAAADENQAGR